MQLGGRGTRCGHDSHRKTRSEGEAEGEERRRTLVVVDPIGDPGMIGEGERQRTVAGAGSDADVAQAEISQGLDECGREGVVAVAALHERPQYSP